MNIKSKYHNPITTLGDEYKEYIIGTFWKFTLIQSKITIDSIGWKDEWNSYRVVFKDYRKFKK